MSNPINKVIAIILSLAIVCGSILVYMKLTVKPEIKSEVSASTTATKKSKKKTHRVIPQPGGLPPIVEDTEEESDEKLDQFAHASLSKPASKNYILGLTLGYDSKVTYNLILGKAVLPDLYAVAKINTDLSKAEAGILWAF